MLLSEIVHTDDLQTTNAVEVVKRYVESNQRQGSMFCSLLSTNKIWSGRRESNPQRSDWQPETLPVELCLQKYGKLNC